MEQERGGGAAAAAKAHYPHPGGNENSMLLMHRLNRIRDAE